MHAVSPGFRAVALHAECSSQILDAFSPVFLPAWKYTHL
jgi:hypothetical protein